MLLTFEQRLLVTLGSFVGRGALSSEVAENSSEVAGTPTSLKLSGVRF